MRFSVAVGSLLTFFPELFQLVQENEEFEYNIHVCEADSIEMIDDWSGAGMGGVGADEFEKRKSSPVLVVTLAIPDTHTLSRRIAESLKCITSLQGSFTLHSGFPSPSLSVLPALLNK